MGLALREVCFYFTFFLAFLFFLFLKYGRVCRWDEGWDRIARSIVSNGWNALRSGRMLGYQPEWSYLRSVEKKILRSRRACLHGVFFFLEILGESLSSSADFSAIGAEIFAGFWTGISSVKFSFIWSVKIVFFNSLFLIIILLHRFSYKAMLSFQEV